MSDLVVSYLRTIVPILWGAAITWALGAVSWLGDALAFLNLDPTSPGVVAFVTGVVVAGWYVIWRKVEPSLPSWLTTILLGAAKAPSYAAATEAAQIASGKLADLEREADEQARPSKTPYTEPF